MIPHKSNETDKPKFFAKTLYKARDRIVQGMKRIKRFSARVTWQEDSTTKGQTAQNFRSIVSFTAGLCLIKSVQTA